MYLVDILQRLYTNEAKKTDGKVVFAHKNELLRVINNLRQERIKNKEIWSYLMKGIISEMN